MRGRYSIGRKLQRLNPVVSLLASKTFHIPANLHNSIKNPRFEAELASLTRAHESELDTLARAQRAAAERAEQQLEAELRAASKRLRGEHERDLRHFRDTLKQELRLLKQVC